ncbi:MAG: hypothetical protein V1779_10540 [bacterium]
MKDGRTERQKDGKTEGRKHGRTEARKDGRTTDSRRQTADGRRETERL